MTGSEIQELMESVLQDAPYDHGELYSYHSRGYIRHHYDVNDEFRFGVEVEKEDEEGIDICCRYQGNADDYLPFSWRAERDGSLSDEIGYELISPIYNLTDLTKFTQHVQNPVLTALIMGGSSYSCGGHITVSCERGTYDYVAKARQIAPLLHAMYPKRAKSTGYAKFSTYDMLQNRNDKYSSIHLKGDCMEIRVFPQVKNVTQLLWRVQFVQLLMLFDKYYNRMQGRNAYQIATADELFAQVSKPESLLYKHLSAVYKKRMGEKLLLFKAYINLGEQLPLDFVTYSRTRKAIPTDLNVRVAPHKTDGSDKTTQMSLFDVRDNFEDVPTEA